MTGSPGINSSTKRFYGARLLGYALSANNWARALFPLGALSLIAYSVWGITSRKADVIFSGSYRMTIEQPPHLEPGKRFDFAPSRRAARRTLWLVLRCPDGPPLRVAFWFPSVRECEHWAGRLATMIAQLPPPPGVVVEPPSPA